MLPTEKLKAMPPTAAPAPRKAVGRFQDTGRLKHQVGGEPEQDVGPEECPGADHVTERMTAASKSFFIVSSCVERFPCHWKRPARPFFVPTAHRDRLAISSGTPPGRSALSFPPGFDAEGAGRKTRRAQNMLKGRTGTGSNFLSGPCAPLRAQTGLSL